jgi:hypothetical protein
MKQTSSPINFNPNKNLMLLLQHKVAHQILSMDSSKLQQINRTTTSSIYWETETWRLLAAAVQSTSLVGGLQGWERAEHERG